MYGDHMNAGGWFLSVVVTLLVLAAIVAAIIWFVGNRSTSGQARLEGGVRPESALELLPDLASSASSVTAELHVAKNAPTRRRSVSSMVVMRSCG